MIEFNKEMTNICKGAAVLLLLCHHLFSIYGGGGLSLPLRGIGASGKLCVAIFLFLSGFGLVRTKQGVRLQMIRTARLLVNFWLVAIPFIALSCLFTNRTFATIYPNGIFPRFFMDMFGLTTSTSGFNATWWFMGIIIPLYVLFPFIKTALDYSALLTLVLVAIAWLVGIRWASCWNIPFVLGAIFGRTDCLEKFVAGLRMREVIGLMIGFPTLLVMRCMTSFVTPLEPLYALAFIVCIYGVCVRFAGLLLWLKKCFAYLGKHSMNIFFLHTFLYLYFFKTFFVQLNPLVGLVVLLVMSLGCSILIEKFKDAIRLNSCFLYLKEKCV